MHALAAKEPGDVAKWDAVLAAVRQAEALAGSDPEARPQIDEIRAEAQAGGDAARRDRTLLDAVADVRSDKAELGPSGTDAAFARAFREAGIDVDAQPSEAGAKVRARPASIVVAAAAALDAWAQVRREDRPSDERWRRPLEAARSADPEPFRDHVRAAVMDADESSRESALRELAAERNVGELAPASAVLLAGVLKDTDAAVRLLRTAAGRHPDDVWVNHALAQRLSGLRPAPREEQVRYYSMARAVRPGTAHELAHLLNDMGRSDEALAVFADLIARHPADARHLTCYGQCLQDHGRREAGEVLARAESVAREAVRIRPQDARAHVVLGNALSEQGKLDEAIPEFREAIRLKPDDATAHSNLGQALASLREPDKTVAAYREAIAECHEAIRLKPEEALFYCNLAYALNMQGKENEAIAEYRKAIRLKPDSAWAHANLGCCLHGQGKLEEAVAAYREALRLKPNDFFANCNLAPTLADQGKFDEAIAECRESIRRMPDYSTMPRKNLALVLRQRGDFTGSLAELRRFRELGKKRPNWSDAWDELVEKAERKAALADRLPGILKGADQPRDNVERLDFARMCRDTMRYAAAARLWADALGADPGLGQDRNREVYYQAACAAALAATGRGKDPSSHDDEKVRLRKQTLIWLKADLAVWAKLVDSKPLKADLAALPRIDNAGPPSTRTAAFHTLWSWRRNPDLISVREPDALAKLPLAERKEWQAFWTEVEAVIKRAAASGNKSVDSRKEDIR